NACVSSNKCCTKYCVNGACRCKPNFMICRKHEHCCSGNCLNGRCDGGCRSAGVECDENFNCCTGLICKNGVCKANAAKAKCDETNCGGCCEGTVCRDGSDRSACGVFRGACTTCAKLEVCTDGACVPVKQKCSPANCSGCCIRGVCQAGTEPSGCGIGIQHCAICSDSTPVCAAGVCVGCASNGDCSGSTPICSSGTCVGCASNGDCSGNTPFCSGAVCVACLSAGDCSATAADTCASGACVCGSNAACSGSTPLCSGGSCVGCSSNADCSGSTPLCNAGSCVACATNADCSGATPVCCANSCVAGAWSNETTLATLGADPMNLDSPQGVAVSVDGKTIWIADRDNHRISIWTKSGGVWSDDAIVGSGPGSSSSEFNRPTGLAVTSDGLTMFVADKTNGRVSIWTKSGSTWSNQSTMGSSGSGASQLSTPQGLALAADGLTLWVDDYGNNRISVWKKLSGVWTHIENFGSAGSGDLDFQSPYSVSASTNGLVVGFADTLNDRVSIWEYTAGSWENHSLFG
ncbi:MAG: NHL repeat-containing protein, partial [Thermomicrobiales bacterium]